MYRLIFTAGELRNRRLIVKEGELTIGSADDNFIVITQDQDISLRHAVIQRRERGYWIRFTGAFGTVTVNGSEVSEQQLQPGDEIGLGQSRILFQDVVESQQTSRRRLSTIQAAAILLIVSLLLVQAVLIFGGGILNRNPPVSAAVVAEETVTGEPESAPAAAEPAVTVAEPVPDVVPESDDDRVEPEPEVIHPPQPVHELILEDAFCWVMTNSHMAAVKLTCLYQGEYLAVTGVSASATLTFFAPDSDDRLQPLYLPQTSDLTLDMPPHTNRVTFRRSFYGLWPLHDAGSVSATSAVPLLARVEHGSEIFEFPLAITSGVHYLRQ